MKTSLKRTLFLLLFIGLYAPSFAQTDSFYPKKQISFKDFLHQLGQHNLDYAAELVNLDIALAEAESAKIFNDPIISFEVIDHGQKRRKMGYEFASSLGWTLELGGKRKARMNMAQSQVDLTEVLLSDYFKNLRADATLQFLKAIKEKNILDVKVSSYESMKKLAHSDSIRFKLGEITEIDARQSKLEATSLLNEVIQQEADWENALYEINKLIGHQDLDSAYLPEGNLTTFDRNYDLQELIELAQESRSDLQAALQNKNMFQRLLMLTKAERAIDLDLSIGVGKATEVLNIEAATPSINSVLAGVAIPFKFSNTNKGNLKTAQYALQQSKILIRKVEMDIRTEVYQAYSQFRSTQKQVKHFDLDLLQSAQHILNGKIYSYQRGETSLLEVLDAQRTFNEMQENYYETQFSNGISLIELQRVTGIWDIDL